MRGSRVLSSKVHNPRPVSGQPDVPRGPRHGPVQESRIPGGGSGVLLFPFLLLYLSHAVPRLMGPIVVRRLKPGTTRKIKPHKFINGRYLPFFRKPDVPIRPSLRDSLSNLVSINPLLSMHISSNRVGCIKCRDSYKLLIESNPRVFTTELSFGE